MIINSLPRTSYCYNQNSQVQCAPMFRLKPQLSADTVSFCAKPPKFDNTFFMDALGRGYDSAEPGLISMAKEFHGALKRVTEKLKAFGFEYDEAYNAASPTKKKKSVIDKYERQGNAQDMIRGTIYWQDQQDVMAFKKFVEEMKLEGWTINRLKKKDPQTGKLMKGVGFPDIEIRQQGITSESLAPLGEYMQRSEITRPRASTYADWQVRFVNQKDKDHECEVIFLYGPHYKDAKEIEHKFVYEPIRDMKKLHVDMEPEHHPKGSAGYTIASNFREIEKRLIQFISQPLYANAFNADLKIKDAEKLPVEISKSYAHLIMNYAKSIQKAIPSYYSQITKELLKDEQVMESIKASTPYKIRDDKTITPRQIKDARRDIRQKLIIWKEKDTEKMLKVLGDLKLTIEKFLVKD